MAETLTAPRTGLTAVPLSRRRFSLRRLPRTQSALVGGTIVLVLLLTALFGPLLETHDPIKIDVAKKLVSPSLAFPLGTDQLGRDMLSRIVYGSRASLMVAALTAIIACLIGIPIGATAGFVGGRLDNALMRLMDGVMAFPALLLAIGLVAAIGPGLR